MSIEQVPAIIIGAGVVGLACAKKLSEQGLSPIILERHQQIGQETSSRNSEVIHAGLYYPPHTDKTRLCVEGRKMLYDYCRQHAIPYQQCGKLIVATDETQLTELHALHQQAIANQVDDIQLISAATAQNMEPQLSCVAALCSSSTGIIDSHTFMHSLLHHAEHNGAILALSSQMQSAQVTSDGIRVHVVSGTEPIQLKTQILINCAGLFASEVATRIDGLAGHLIPQTRYAKGNYYGLTGKAPFSRLIYPIPEPGGLGIHLTLDLNGQARFGPDVEWIDDIDYTVNSHCTEKFYHNIRRYYPAITPEQLRPDYAGIRPKIGDGGHAQRSTPHQDFMIQGPEIHGVPGLVNLFGIESPGLTACLAIAERVATLVAG
ncbi:MAG: FAD-dependent oxidoreductase [Gammaproteobacteria bacterium RIFCSPHIGHO2_12_FULL_45_9]|nr:MAG: FAD-dependent oxidoreductase [Gammaproteobacteria bacterium RIFCSPHIGHO2_12_FULL_45_9]